MAVMLMSSASDVMCLFFNGNTVGAAVGTTVAAWEEQFFQVEEGTLYCVAVVAAVAAADAAAARQKALGAIVIIMAVHNPANPRS